MKQYHTMIGALAATGLATVFGCATQHEVRMEHEVKPLRVEPIHITVDVNVRVDREIDNFFNDLDAQDPTIKENVETPPVE